LGGPGETPATLAETLSNIDKLDRTVVFFFCGMRIYPHTALYRLAIDEKMISPAQDLLEHKIIDGIIDEPIGGAHRNPLAVMDEAGDTIEDAIKSMSNMDAAELKRQRQDKFLAMGRVEGTA